jgi:hypothetical protein
MREKIKKKHKQLIIGGNPAIIYLHTPHHVGKGHDYAYSEITNDHIWPQRSVTCVFLMA